MKIVLIVVAVCIVSVVVVAAWRRMSVARGANARDEKLLAQLDVLGTRIEAGEAVSPEEVATLAAHPELRFMLFAAIRHLHRPDLLPTGYSSSVAQGESALAYWMMHPNELQDAPEKIEFVETVQRTVDGRIADFHVYRYKMPDGHWAAKNGWLLGLAGPMPAEGEPYTEMPGAFSRAGDIDGRVKPAELVDSYVGMLREQGASN